MSNEAISTSEDQPKHNVEVRASASDSVYGIGLFGAWYYYFKHAQTNQERVQAFFKGLFWPAFMVYELLVFLNKK